MRVGVAAGSGAQVFKVRLGSRNRLTLPGPVVKALGVAPGDELIVELDGDSPKVVSLRPVLRSYAGIAAGVYGTAEEAGAYVRGERDAWGR